MVKSLKVKEPCLILTIFAAILIGVYADIRELQLLMRKKHQ